MDKIFIMLNVFNGVLKMNVGHRATKDVISVLLINVRVYWLMSECLQ